MTQIQIGSLFSGIGGLEHGLAAGLASHGHSSRVAWQCEADPKNLQILKKHHPSAWKFNNVSQIGSHNLSPVHIVCGGFPCQDLSCAGAMAGLGGERSGLFFEMARVCGEIRPQIIVMENVAGIFAIPGALPTIFGTLADLGYDAVWGSLRASSVGAPHRRDRWFAVCWRGSKANQDLANSSEVRPQGAKPIGGKFGQLHKPSNNSGKSQGMANTKGQRTWRLSERPERESVANSERCNRRLEGMANTDSRNCNRWSDQPEWQQKNRAFVGRIGETLPSDQCHEMANTDLHRLQGINEAGPTKGTALRGTGTQQPWQTQPGLGGGLDGLPSWLDVYAHRWPAGQGVEQYPWEPPRLHKKTKQDTPRLKALGNAVVPQQAAIIGEWIASNLLEAPC